MAFSNHRCLIVKVSLQLFSEEIDFGLSLKGYMQELYFELDYTNYIIAAEITISSCQPKRLVALYNIARPFP
jgi:hypothetical protein